eukprot:TRINITY_DN3600_c0_g1_i1.p1 TRINITY_DN3600_c0_g1~~TRINITY_DN3600_c0_g1_i1.p1  ORF type:complete len:306 (+),score=78.04 TRINITY_DN3600_c0_g1_i1:67-918(+)
MQKAALFVGPTGAGKSQQISRYSKGAPPVVGNDLQSQTTETKAYEVDLNGQKALFYDTPGLGDSQQRDQVFLNELVETLQKNFTGIHKIYFMMPVTETRFNSYLQICFSLLLQLCPDLKSKPSVLTVILTRADQDHKDYWNPSNAPIKNKIEGLKKVIQEKFQMDTTIIVTGEGNQAEFLENITNAPADIFCQTQFMRNVETLDTKSKKAYEELEQAKKENAADQEKIASLQAAYDKAQQEKAASQDQMQKEITSLKEQINNFKPEVHNHYYSDGGGSDCIIL